MTIDALLNIVAPPAFPIGAFGGPWEVVEAGLETTLPPDYKELAQLYGRGRFMEFLTINLPGDREQRGSLEGELHMAREVINYGVPLPYPAWPDPGGLLCVGLTNLNDRLFWLPRGAPCDWRMVFWDRAFQNFETFDCDLTGFLAGLATGAIRPEGLAGEVLTSKRRFEPWRSVAGRGSLELPKAALGIGALSKVVSPPAEPVETFAGPWEPLEAYLGTALPQDYKDFALLYGAGVFMDFLIVHVPSIKGSLLTLEPQVRDAPLMFWPGEELPHSFWPHIDGLIRFGCTDFGDQLYWLPEGPPDTWKVVMWDRGWSEFETFDCGLAEFLGGLASGMIVPRRSKKEDLEPYEPMFRPR